MARQTEIRYVNLYMVGSTACQLEPVQQKKKPVRLPRAPRQQKLLICVDSLTIIGFVVAFVMIIAMTVGVVQLNAARSEAAALEAYVASLEEENAELKTTYREGYDVEEIQRYAEAMGYIPISQAQTVYVHVEEPRVPEEPTAWEDFCMFLAGLFA